MQNWNLKNARIYIRMLLLVLIIKKLIYCSLKDCQVFQILVPSKPLALSSII